jgi:hypothetical protein
MFAKKRISTEVDDVKQHPDSQGRAGKYSKNTRGREALIKAKNGSENGLVQRAVFLRGAPVSRFDAIDCDLSTRRFAVTESPLESRLQPVRGSLKPGLQQMLSAVDLSGPGPENGLVQKRVALVRPRKGATSPLISSIRKKRPRPGPSLLGKLNAPTILEASMSSRRG